MKLNDIAIQRDRTLNRRVRLRATYRLACQAWNWDYPCPDGHRINRLRRLILCPSGHG
jgi:hypothetical protein